MSRLFTMMSYDSFLTSLLLEMGQEINNEDRDAFLNRDREQYLDYIESKYRQEGVQLRWDRQYVTVPEGGGAVPTRSGSSSSQFVTQRVKYHVPVSGDRHLLQRCPNRVTHPAVEVQLYRDECIFELIATGDGSNARQQADYVRNSVDSNVAILHEQLETFNRRLRAAAAEVFDNRKRLLLKQASLVESLGVPVRKRDDVPATFQVPIQKKVITFTKPATSLEPFQPDWEISDEIYQYILDIIHDTGTAMEAHPTLYLDKGEEALRDQFLMTLGTHFDSVTGETFNRMGKTDIFIRHDQKNVFVDECKFWKGKVRHFETIDQLLGYLTWRNSKVAITYFVDQKNLQPVLDTILASTPEHVCFVKFKGRPHEGRFDYRFRLPHDESRLVDLSINCFHFPIA